MSIQTGSNVDIALLRFVRVHSDAGTPPPMLRIGATASGLKPSYGTLWCTHATLKPKVHCGNRFDDLQSAVLSRHNAKPM